ncbi:MULTISPECIES: TrkA C-terminal domain-containing protein [Halomicrobium]|uniref:TrkA-C domain protein n=2 Tax=Halomicrobium mukohataei TaxID=57705 RepID=C7P3H4_HALMD|nr:MULTISPECIES: TrkA C-terminal domain-containing protein [Halomicrobium]ACV47646.1 TrkA-C domain protein [Halomicrobium mukohataei DSM 12286]QCD66102.1 potassium transporter TrkA [Halomicrobium mukohataei]QFR20907.1 potassium transporter TrkA [Halomicrobium sp. ZPS1]
MTLQLVSGVTGALVDTTARIAGTAVLAGFLAAAVALFYRWYVRERVPVGLALLVGLSGVAAVAGATSLLAQQLVPGGADPDALVALLNVVTFLVGGLGAYAGMRVGDTLGIDLFAATGGNGIDGEVSELVKAVGRVIAVEIPEEIDDIVGYDPVAAATRETLAGRTFLFPRRLTQAELRERFVSRLKTDYGVGHVDVEFDEAGNIEYLALGSRAAGIGPTLPPATNAVAIRADPANAASAGDLVQVWETDPPRRVLTGELRGVADEIVTVAIDAADTPKLDPTSRYKLVTLPVQDRPDREFASLLRAADETLATVTVAAGSPIDGTPVGSLSVTVAAVTRDDERPVPLPSRDRVLRAGDVLYAIATPDALRKLEAATAAPEGAVAEPADGTDDEPATAAEDATAPEPAASDRPPADHRPDQSESERRADASDGQPDAGDEVVGDDADDTSTTESEADASGDDGADDAALSGDAFPDSDDLPGIDPEDATASPSDGGDDDTEAIPDTAAFPDTDDLPGSELTDEGDARADREDDGDGTDGATARSAPSDEDEAAGDFADLLDTDVGAGDDLDDLLDEDTGDTVDLDDETADGSEADDRLDEDTDETDDRDRTA